MKKNLPVMPKKKKKNTLNHTCDDFGWNVFGQRFVNNMLNLWILTLGFAIPFMNE
jgi:hypothetical protein